MIGPFIRGACPRNGPITISGLPDSALYKDIGSRFEAFAGWLDDPATLTVRFEDLRSDDPLPAWKRIAAHACPEEANPDALGKRCLSAIDPERSHTFHQGNPAGWRDSWNPGLDALMEEHAGRWQERLGYR